MPDWANEITVQDVKPSNPGPCYTALSSIGGRESQQDSLFVGELNGSLLAVVCDGMGGIQGGERAGARAVSVLVDAFSARPPGSIPAFLRSAADRMDDAVYELADENGRMGAGSTVVAAVLNPEGLWWLSVGDSRLYLYREGQLLCPFRPHNYHTMLDDLLAEGRITPEAAQQERACGEALVSYLGMGGLRQVEINPSPFRPCPGDRILLCSDGLYRSVPDPSIRNALELELPVDQTAELLLNRALETGGAVQDNTSLILIAL